jgi:hypothetical protein
MFLDHHFKVTTWYTRKLIESDVGRKPSGQVSKRFVDTGRKELSRLFLFSFIINQQNHSPMMPV